MGCAGSTPEKPAKYASKDEEEQEDNNDETEEKETPKEEHNDNGNNERGPVSPRQTGDNTARSRSTSPSPRRGAGDSPTIDKSYRKYARHAPSIASTNDTNPQAYGQWLTREPTFTPRKEADYDSVRRSHKVYDSLPADLKVILNHPQNLHGRSRSYHSPAGPTPRPETTSLGRDTVPFEVWGPEESETEDSTDDDLPPRSNTPWHQEKMEHILPKYAPLKRRQPYLPPHLFQKVKVHDVTKKKKKRKKRDKAS